MQEGFVKIAAATPAIRVGDPAYNGAAVIDLMQQAAALGVKIAVFPELCLTGYTCGDLFLQKTLLSGALDALRAVREASRGLDLVALVCLPLSVRGCLDNCAAAVY